MSGDGFLEGRLSDLEQRFNDVSELAEQAWDMGADMPLAPGGFAPILGGQFVFPGEAAGSGGEPFVGAWSIRVTEVPAEGGGEPTYLREVFSPVWRLRDLDVLPVGFSLGAWGVLPSECGGSGKTLYAVLRLTFSAGTYERTEAELTFSEDVSGLSDTPIVPPDPNATGGGEGVDGVYHLIVPIGRWGSGGSFEQWHVGVIAEDFLPRRALQEEQVVTGVGLSDDGKRLQVRRKRALIPLPLGKTPAPDPDEVALPSGGEGGSLALGPIVYEGGKFVQYAGRWSFAEGKWSFARENDVAAVEYGALQGAFRDGAYRGGLLSGAVPDFGAAPSAWLGLHTADVFKGVTYTPPANETGSGSLDGQGQTFTYLGTEPSESGTENILTTIVEDANNITTYQDAPDGGEGGE